MVSRSLAAVLSEARAVGYLGPGDPRTHLAHAQQCVRVVEVAAGDRPPVSFADLGTGGGVPGLVLAAAWPDVPGVLIESSARRSASLRVWVAELALGNVTVLSERAEDVAHHPRYRERFDIVTARSFGAPAATAEIAAGLVRVGGHLVVSEPPDRDAQRWPPEGLGALGFGPARIDRRAGASFAVIRKDLMAVTSVPRRRGTPFKRPRW